MVWTCVLIDFKLMVINRPILKYPHAFNFHLSQNVFQVFSCALSFTVFHAYFIFWCLVALFSHFTWKSLLTECGGLLNCCCVSVCPSFSLSLSLCPSVCPVHDLKKSFMLETSSDFLSSLSLVWYLVLGPTSNILSVCLSFFLSFGLSLSLSLSLSVCWSVCLSD